MKPLTKKINPVLVESLKDIPAKPGVYMMLDKLGKVIYIGKARNLKDRVRTYLNPKSWDMRPKLYFMMPKVKEIKTVITHSEKEALILEANLVNRHQPKYNVTLKDDKKFPWLMITYDEEYPRVLPIRDVAGFKNKYPKTKNKFFGPYSDAGAMWETYKIIKEGFQLRLRRKPLFKDRPCMNYHIGLCSGPCQKLISKDDYFKIVAQVDNFLLGKYGIVLKNLNNSMKIFSKKYEYEKAAKIRDTTNKIHKVLEKQIVISDDHKLSQDVFASAYEDKNMILELLQIREGKLIAFESLVIEIPANLSHTAAFNEGIKQYYIRISNEELPKEIVVQYELSEKDYIAEWLSSRLQKTIKIICPAKGQKKELVDMAEKNAKIALQKYIVSNIGRLDNTNVLKELQQDLNLKKLPNHIECFDISHLGGTNTVGSMVCFVNGQMDKNKYRKYKLRSVVNKIDDYEAIKEIVKRRYRDKTMHSPDLIIIDGGKGQLSSAKEALESLNIDLNTVDLISIAKRLEEVFKLERKKSILLPSDSKSLFLLQRIRDEAHRFAIAFQRDKRTKELFKL